jgi:Zn-dependent peptidase ImmA (M78 family)
MQTALFEFPVKEPLRAISLTRKQQRRAGELSQLLFECGDDVAFWCERLGYEVYERNLKGTVAAVLKDGYIFLAKGLTNTQKVLSISHEIFHHEFHASIIAFREATDKNVDWRESQAESFAVLVAEPSLLKYGTIEQFRYKSKLPVHLRQVRERLFYLVKR